MPPRPYRLGRRQVATEETRGRIIAAARDILSDEGDVLAFTVEAVARRAAVARMTVYYQFRSKRGLLEALFDDLANRGLMPHLGAVFHEPDPARALDGVIAAFAAFWASDRLVLRRARALAALDPEIGESVRARDERRRVHLHNILERLSEKEGRPRAQALPRIVNVLQMLTSFETFDALAADDGARNDVTETVRRLAAAALESSTSSRER
jgi:AcrR family transcriptional regulator